MRDSCSPLYPGCSLGGDGHTGFQLDLPPWPKPAKSYSKHWEIFKSDFVEISNRLGYKGNNIKSNGSFSKMLSHKLTIIFPFICVMCWEESINHIFLHCEVAADIWNNFIGGVVFLGFAQRILRMQWNCGWEIDLLDVGAFSGGFFHVLPCGLFGGTIVYLYPTRIRYVFVQSWGLEEITPIKGYDSWTLVVMRDTRPSIVIF